MRILHVLAQKPGQTGSGVYLLNIIRVAAQKGHKQCLVAGIGAGDADYQNLLPKEVTFIPVIFDVPELPFPVPGMSDDMPYPSTRYRDLTEQMYGLWCSAFTRALKVADSFAPDLIIVHHLWLLAALVRNLFPGLKVLAVCHGTELRQLATSRRFADQVIAGCRDMDRVLALTVSQKQELMTSYGIHPDKIVVAGSGYNGEIFYPPTSEPLLESSSNKSIKALYAGKLCAAKGVPALLKAISHLPLGQEDFKLFLVGSGSGEEYSEIISLAEKCLFEVCLTGQLSQKQLAELMRECRLFIFPSFYEGFSLVTLEALASGMWVVANSLPNLRDWIGKSLVQQGIVEFTTLPRLRLVDIPYPEELPAYEVRLSNAILKQIERIKQHGGAPATGWKETSRAYSWSAILNIIECAYQELAADNSH